MGMVRKLLITALVVGAVASIAGYGTYSAFSSSTTNSGNVFSAGTVVIGDNSSGGTIYNSTGLKPADSTSGCIKLTYTGSLSATVSLYTASTSGTIGQYVDMTIDKVTYSGSPPTFPACGSPATSTNLFTGTLSNFTTNKTTFANGIQTNPASQTKWNQNDFLYYRFTLTLQDNNSAQGLTSTTGFKWEAQNQ
jgi:predicted ribosomally synthesized peptide with SipW-like signal peptide